MRSDERENNIVTASSKKLIAFNFNENNKLTISVTTKIFATDIPQISSVVLIRRFNIIIVYLQIDLKAIFL